MDTPFRLIVGLGNPGTKYAGTRHNAGFFLLDRLIDTFAAEPIKGPGNSLLWSGTGPSQQTVYLMKPLTYMNLSGEAVLAFLGQHKMEIGDILVTYDDISLPLGRLRIRPRGSAGGQKGIKHIIETLGTSEIPRLRIGIDSDARMGRPLPDFVLEDFAEGEVSVLRDALDRAEKAALCWLREGMGPAMAQFNANTTHGESDSTVSMNGGA